jgi:hypothetical protein
VNRGELLQRDWNNLPPQEQKAILSFLSNRWGKDFLTSLGLSWENLESELQGLLLLAYKEGTFTPEEYTRTQDRMKNFMWYG